MQPIDAMLAEIKADRGSSRMKEAMENKSLFHFYVCTKGYRTTIREERMCTEEEARAYWNEILHKHDPGPLYYLCYWGRGTLEESYKLLDDGI